MSAVGGALAKALVEAQAKFGAIPKTANNPFFKSKYADLATVVAAAQPILSEVGLAISQFPTQLESGEPGLTTILMHQSGEALQSSMPLLASKLDAQGQGSALTYARRYAYMAVLGLVADEDDDGNKAQAPKKVAQKPVERPETVTDVSDLGKAKQRLREAVKAAGLNGSEYAWVKDATDKDIKAINEHAAAAEELAKAGLLKK